MSEPAGQVLESRLVHSPDLEREDHAFALERLPGRKVDGEVALAYPRCEGGDSYNRHAAVEGIQADHTGGTAPTLLGPDDGIKVDPVDVPSAWRL